MVLLWLEEKVVVTQNQSSFDTQVKSALSCVVSVKGVYKTTTATANGNVTEQKN